MVDSYRTDQFFNVRQRANVDGGSIAGPGGLRQQGIRSKNPTNEKFAFPGPYRYELGADGKMEKVRVRRGFMRILTSKNLVSKDKRPPNYRFFFQFNPLSIHRSVPMSEGVYNPMLQTPEELAQPIVGRTSFGFEIMIDRSFEVTGGYKSIADATRKNPGNASGDVLAENYPDTIGVLSDISILDTIVGQKITADLIEQVIAQQTLYASKAQPSDSSEESAQAFDPEKFRAGYEVNYGNQAFLMPNPVRVVFSSLMMVDGFVTSMAVNYVKFNAAMVPITATISVQMQAVYIGFAKSQTALQVNLDKAQESLDNANGDREPNPSNDPAFIDAAKQVFAAFATANVQVAYSGQGDGSIRDVSAQDDTITLIIRFPNIAQNKNNDIIYKALGEQTIRSVSIDSFEGTAIRNKYATDEEYLDSDGNVRLVTVSASDILTAGGTNAQEDWWSGTYDGSERVTRVFDIKNAEFHGADSTARRLLLNATQFSNWEKESNQRRILVKMKLRITCNVLGTPITLLLQNGDVKAHTDQMSLRLVNTTNFSDYVSPTSPSTEGPEVLPGRGSGASTTYVAPGINPLTEGPEANRNRLYGNWGP